MTKRLRNRPPNQERLESMQRWYMVALADARVMAKSDAEELYLNAKPIAGMSSEQWLNLVMRRYCGNVDTRSLSREEADALEWLGSVQEYRSSLSTKPRSDKMLAYKIAAALFNNSLAHAQQFGKQLNEKPITPGALQRALHRVGITPRTT